MVITKKVLIFFLINLFYLSNISFALINSYFEKKEHELLSENFSVLVQTNNFDFFGCVKDILYVIGGYVVECKNHTQSSHHHNNDAALLVKRLRGSNFSQSYYYLCVDHNLCYAVNLLRIK